MVDHLEGGGGWSTMRRVESSKEREIRVFDIEFAEEIQSALGEVGFKHRPWW